MLQDDKLRKKCKYCGKYFYARDTFDFKRRVYCSRECSYDDRKINKIKKICEYCGKKYFETVYRKDTSRFCSVNCRGNGLSGKKNASYKGGKTIRKYHVSTGHIMRYIVIRGIRAKGGGEVFEHRFIAENALGRPLKKIEIVHHINGDTLDNRNSNLLVCSNKYHAWLHKEMGYRYMREKFA